MALGVNLARPRGAVPQWKHGRSALHSGVDRERGEAIDPPRGGPTRTQTSHRAMRTNEQEF